MGRNSGRSLAQRRAEEAQRQGGKCYWCQVEMTPIPEDAHLMSGPRPPTMVTLDHLFPRGHPERSHPSRGQQRYVAACHKCNLEHGRLNSIEQNRRRGFTKPRRFTTDDPSNPGG